MRQVLHSVKCGSDFYDTDAIERMTDSTPNPDSQSPADSQSPEEARRKKLEQIIALGHDPYGHRFDDRDLLGDIRKRSDEIRYVLEDGTELEIPDLTTLGDGGLKAWAKD